MNTITHKNYEELQFQDLFFILISKHLNSGQTLDDIFKSIRSRIIYFADIKTFKHRKTLICTCISNSSGAQIKDNCYLYQNDLQ